MAQALDDAAEGEVVVGHAGGGGGRAFFCATRVIVGEADNREGGKCALGFEVAQFAQKDVSAVLVGDIHFPADIVGWRDRADGLDHGVTLKHGGVARALPGAKTGGKIRRALAAVAPRDGGGHELAVVADADAVLERVVPDEPGGRVGEGILAVFAHAVGITAGKAGETFFQVVGREGRRAPLVAIGAEDASAVGVIEQHEIAHELVLIGRDALAEDAERRIAVAGRDVAEDLVVGAVFFDHVDDVLDATRLANALGDGARELAGAGGEAGGHDGVAAEIPPDGFGKFRQVIRGGHGHEGERAGVVF